MPVSLGLAEKGSEAHQGADAEPRYEQSLLLAHEVSDVFREANYISRLGDLATVLPDCGEAQTGKEQALNLLIGSTNTAPTTSRPRESLEEEFGPCRSPGANVNSLPSRPSSI